MTEDGKIDSIPELPQGIKGGMAARAVLNALSGIIPLAGGLLSAAASAWSEQEQKRINDFLQHSAQMHAVEMREKEQTILEISARVDTQDEKIKQRIESPEYQGLLRKAFRDWAGTESERKRVFIRNLLANAASPVGDLEMIKLFLQWISTYSEFHFAVIGAIFNNAGITRGDVWRELGRSTVREDSADADLFRLLFRDISTGEIVRQHRERDYTGNFLAKRKQPASAKGETKIMKSAFDDIEQYELTELGKQFVHYAMTDVPPKLEFHQAQSSETDSLNMGK